MLNRSLQGISGLMEPRITALRKVEGVHRFDPLLTRKIWWDEKLGDDSVRRRHTQKNTSGIIGYGYRKRRAMSMAPPAANLEKRYKLQSGEGLRMVGQGLGMVGGCGGCQSGRGLPIRLSNPASMRY
jgi:hypothetical protein